MNQFKEIRAYKEVLAKTAGVMIFPSRDLAKASQHKFKEAGSKALIFERRVKVANLAIMTYVVVVEARS